MKRGALVLTICLIFLTFDAPAQNAPGATGFSSRYTNLDKDCKTIKGEPKGTDDAYDCRGVAGYRVHIWFAAAAQLIRVETPAKESVGDLPMQDFDWDQTKINVEWRMANGAPFAVIIRVFKYGEEREKEFDYWGKKIGEELRIVGLKGFEHIDYRVDAKTPDANQKARELADDGFAAKK